MWCLQQQTKIGKLYTTSFTSTNRQITLDRRKCNICLFFISNSIYISNKNFLHKHRILIQLREMILMKINMIINSIFILMLFMIARSVFSDVYFPGLSCFWLPVRYSLTFISLDCPVYDCPFGILWRLFPWIVLFLIARSVFSDVYFPGLSWF
jgi:hypothetical protein